MAYNPSISSLEGMRSFFADAAAVPAGAADIIAVGELQHAREIAALMEGLTFEGWRFEGSVVVKRLARVDALLVSTSAGELRELLNNPRAADLPDRLNRIGWKISKASKIHGQRVKIPNTRVPRLPMLNRLANAIRRLGRHAREKPEDTAYIQRRLRRLRDEVIPRCRATDVEVAYPVPPPAAAVDVSPSSGSSTDSSTSTSTERSSTPSASASSFDSVGTFNSNCSFCVDGRPHNSGYSTAYDSSSSSDESDF